VRRGSIFGLLGPNGAGKSTFINILAGLTRKTAGSVRIWGVDIDERPRQARAAIGVVPQELAADVFFTPRESLEVQAGFYGVPKGERRTDEVLAALGLSDKADSYVRSLSGGMKRRLMVAKAMVHHPPVLILDEPTAGVDVELRRQLWTYVRGLHAQGVTIVLTTHYLEEAQELCDTIAIVNRGQVVASEPTPVCSPGSTPARWSSRPRARSPPPRTCPASTPACAPTGAWPSPTRPAGQRGAGAGRRPLAGVAIRDLATEEPTWRTSSCPHLRRPQRPLAPPRLTNRPRLVTRRTLDRRSRLTGARRLGGILRPMQIGELARQAGETHRTIHYYERIGLLRRRSGRTRDIAGTTRASSAGCTGSPPSRTWACRWTRSPRC
jgi:ABC-type Na+ transport system ATPase subunit NatA